MVRSICELPGFDLGILYPAAYFRLAIGSGGGACPPSGSKLARESEAGGHAPPPLPIASRKYAAGYRMPRSKPGSSQMLRTI